MANRWTARLKCWGDFTKGESVWFQPTRRFAIYPVELVTASVRSSSASLVFNGARPIAWIFPIVAGTLVAKFGGIANAALIISSIYLAGFIVPWFLPATVGKPLPH